MDDLLQEFLVESNENLNQLDEEIVELEANPNDLEILKSIFRTIHTVKGSCGFLGLSRMQGVAHVAEDVLGKMRDGVLEVCPENIGSILSAVDTIRLILTGLEETESKPEGDDSEVIAALQAILDSQSKQDSGDESNSGEAESAMLAAIGEETAEEIAARLEREHAGETASSQLDQTADPAPPAKDTVEEKAAPSAKPPQAAPAAAGSSPGPASKTGATSSVVSHSIRVNVGILDRLMNRVGELVLTRNQLTQLSQKEENSSYKTAILELSRVTTELQEAVMQTRMREIGAAWKKIPRILRDLTNTCGKKIQLNMVGAETELDRQVLDAIEDPLIHMVRNSADHGVETPEVRRKAGKPESGTIDLRARHEGGYIVSEIDDDGAGIDADKIRKKILDKGLLTGAEIDMLSDEQVLNYVFEPGFSTAEKITSVSGRGVGMDVVRTRIQSIGGTVALTSHVG